MTFFATSVRRVDTLPETAQKRIMMIQKIPALAIDVVVLVTLPVNAPIQAPQETMTLGVDATSVVIQAILPKTVLMKRERSATVAKGLVILPKTVLMLTTQRKNATTAMKLVTMLETARRRTVRTAGHLFSAIAAISLVIMHVTARMIHKINAIIVVKKDILPRNAQVKTSDNLCTFK